MQTDTQHRHTDMNRQSPRQRHRQGQRTRMKHRHRQTDRFAHSLTRPPAPSLRPSVHSSVLPSILSPPPRTRVAMDSRTRVHAGTASDTPPWHRGCAPQGSGGSSSTVVSLALAGGGGGGGGEAALASTSGVVGDIRSSTQRYVNTHTRTP